MLDRKLPDWLPQLNERVWTLASGRLLSEIGTGFTLFYASIFFVNQVGLSTTIVGISLGGSSVAGVCGRFLGASLADSKFWGRRRTLLLSMAISAVACIVLSLTYNVLTLVIGNLLMGLGVGLYWPAIESAIADLTTNEQRTEAFALNRLADNLGLGIGVVLAGVLIAKYGSYRALFLIESISFVGFFCFIYFAVPETYKFDQESRKFYQGWGVAFRDRRLMVFVLVNILFTTYVSHIRITIPLYFTNFISSSVTENGFSVTIIGGIFSWHIIFSVCSQLPITRLINKFSRPHGLMLSLLLFGGGFILVWVTGVVSNNALIWAVLGLGLLSLGMVSYTPSSSALVVELSPESLRGVYLSINSLCWAIGYFISSTLGGWVLAQSSGIVYGFWLISAASVGVGILILQYLDRILRE